MSPLKHSYHKIRLSLKAFFFKAAVDAVRERGQTQGATLGDEQPGCCNRRTGGGSSCQPRQDMLDRLSLLLCSRELLGHVTGYIAEEASLGHRNLKEPNFEGVPMSTRHSQRWRSWTTSVDIAWHRDCAITFVVHGVKSGAVQISSSLEAPAHPPMQRSTSGRREECQVYCWYAPCTFHWQLNWLRSARRAMVPWGFATTVILRPPVLPPEVDLVCLQPGRELDRDGGNRAPPLCRGNGAWPYPQSTMRRWLIQERHLSVLTAQAREAAIVNITQRQATTAFRNAQVTRCLKQDPTRLYKDVRSSLPDATSSLKRRTPECYFREKALLACWSAQGRWSPATQTGVSAAWCVQ